MGRPPPPLLLSSYKRRCWSEFLYILTFFVSTYKQTQGLHKYVPPCFQKCDKVFLFLFSPHATQRGESGLLALWAGYQKIRGKLRWAQQSYSKGWLQIQMDAFCINGRLWRPLNEQIAGVKHLWNCHLRKRSREGEERERGGEARGEERKRGFDPGRYLQGSAEQLSITDQRLSSERERELVEALFGSRGWWGSSEQTCTRTASLLLRADQCLSDLKDWHMWWKLDWDRVEGWDRRTRGLRRAARTTKSNIEKAIRGRDKARTGEKEAKLKRKSGC